MYRLRVVINTLVLFNLVMACCAKAIADGYERPEGPTLKQLAKERGVEIGANIPSLVFGKSPNNWQDSPTIVMEKAIVEDQFTIMTASWEMYPGKSWTGPKEYDFGGCDVVWFRAFSSQCHVDLQRERSWGGTTKWPMNRNASNK